MHIGDIFYTPATHGDKFVALVRRTRHNIIIMANV